MNYQFNKKVQLPFDKTVVKVKEELKKEGFGVITTIDMKETLKQKINVDFRNYMILGACNPQFAYKALQSEDRVGLLLPCNVVVQQKENGETEVSIANPDELMSHVNNPALQPLANEVTQSLKRVLDNM